MKSYYANDGFNAAQSNAKSNDLSFEVRLFLLYTLFHLEFIKCI